MQFRYDINGLRAIAVLSVVLYHFDVAFFNGGFVGVDVFFVISGYLMTGIIFSKLAANSFTLSRFYFDRGRRIIPPLAIMTMVVLALGWFVLTQQEYRTLAKHIVRSLGFVSNYSYASEAGYFNAPDHEKWLLHTWSLSVEWQFYMLYPALIVLLRKCFSLHITKLLLIFLTFGSLAWSISSTASQPSDAFFGLPTRAWEMLIGGLIFIFPIQLSNHRSLLLYAAGISLVIFSIFWITPQAVWPGHLALLPAVGTALVIWAARPQAWLLDNALAQWLGRTSYSVYLWHWPIVVGCTNFIENATPYVAIAGIALSLLLGHLSQRYIESSKILVGNWTSPWAKTKLIALLLSAIAAAQYVYERDGVASRINPRALAAEQAANNKNPYRARCTIASGVDHPHCIIGDKPDNVVGIVFGDSHADALFTAVLDSMPSNYGSLLFIAYDSCPTILGVNVHNIISDFRCREYLDRQFAMLAKNYDSVPIIIINRTPVYIYNQTNPLRIERDGPLAYFDHVVDRLSPDYLATFSAHYRASVCALAQNHPTYITMPTPEMGLNVPKQMSRKLIYASSTEISVPLALHNERNTFIHELMRATAEECGSQLLDPRPWLCDNQRCIGSKSNLPLYYDGDHLNETGNKLLTPMFQKIWQ